MLRRLFLVVPLALSSLAIRVPVDGTDDNVTDMKPTVAEKKQDVFYISDEANLDSYLIPPDPHRPEEVLSDIIMTPATYLLPPSPDKQIDYYAPTETGEQTDWYPIAQVAQIQSPQDAPTDLLPPRQPELIPILMADNPSFQLTDSSRRGKSYEREQIIIGVPSRQLEPPLEESVSNHPVPSYGIPSKELELPLEENNRPYDVRPSPPSDYQRPILKPYQKIPKEYTSNLNPAEPTLALHLTPPKRLPTNHKQPTKLYPKKVTHGFKPIPIPVSQFADESTSDVPRAKPVKPFKPDLSEESEYFTPSDEKKVYLYEQAEQKRKLKGENINNVQPAPPPVEDTYGTNAPAEPETSETHYRHPGRNAYPAPLRQTPPPVPSRSMPTPSPTGERTEFRMHGMKGPHSYQFGFDTGKGKNRQFRYEERDNEGRVKGHYGYMDKTGKLRVVNYDADPERGFHAEAPVEQ